MNVGSLLPPVRTVGLIGKARKELDALVSLAMDRTVRLAVTGLSQSGKTVFITSLAHQLLHGLDGAARLPFLSVVRDGRFRGAKVVLQPDLDVSAFRYDQHMQPLMADPPSWPDATDGLSEIRLAIGFQPQGFLQERLSPVATLNLDLIDYPGEWLLDLPLLHLSFDDWSAQALEQCRREPRQRLSAEWRAFMAGLNPGAPAQEDQLRQAAGLYAEFLKTCKSETVGLSQLQPGRFIIPGELKDTPLLTFCPLEPGREPSAAAGSVRAVMQERFETYKERVVRRFFREHFSRFDRQIVLIDVLHALNKGPESFADMRQALQSIMEVFNYGQSGLLRRLFSPKIDRLLFAATKADHVAANQHHNLERLLGRMIGQSSSEALFHGVDVKSMALSSFVCTRTVVREHDGRRLSFVQGTPRDGDQEILLFPGEIPESLPAVSDWDEERFHFMPFRPRRVADVEDQVIPHLRLDKALEFLLGDKMSS